ncbi:LLM class flavin-dependent oxidoreductase [Streptomyces sp. SLBN-118]|uniref:LLM class flavin-dependent oxidoreductase n=1 Tax=Streptomyces sp. SLBN-118 TaxID=2768454 RepID=UPI0037DA123E
MSSCSPAVRLARLTAHTTRLRLGAGGVMPPNHPPLIVAEQYGLLQALARGRIDLGLGRAPGTNQAPIARVEMDVMTQLSRYEVDVPIHHFTDQTRRGLHVFTGPATGPSEALPPGTNLLSSPDNATVRLAGRSARCSHHRRPGPSDPAVRPGDAVRHIGAGSVR